MRHRTVEEDLEGREGGVHHELVQPPRLGVVGVAGVGGSQEPARRFVDGQQESVVIEGHDPGIQMRQDRPDAAALLIEPQVRLGHLGVGLHELPAALAQLARHRIEGPGKRCDLVSAFHIHERVEVSSTDAPGRCGQGRDGTRHPPSQEQPDPYGCEKDDEREEEEEENLNGLERSALGLEHPVGRRRARERAQRHGLLGRLIGPEDQDSVREQGDRPADLAAVAHRVDPPREAARASVRNPVGGGIVDFPHGPAG